MKKIFLKVLIIIFVLGFINFIPTFSIKTKNMIEIKGSNISVFYETNKESAVDVFNLAEKESNDIINKLALKNPDHVNIYIYDNHNTLIIKKYGYVTLLIDLFSNLDWYIGDNKKSNVLLLSPTTQTSIHDYESIKNTAIHEMVHAYTSKMNLDLWTKEGIAVFLTNQKQNIDNMEIPSFKEMQTSNPLKFANINGYAFSYSYMDFLDQKYGFDAIIKFLNSNNYELSFNKSEKELYDEWLLFMKQ